MNNYMEREHDFTAEQLQHLEQRFTGAISAVANVFGDNAFRRFRTTEDHAPGYENVVSKAVYDVQMIGLADVPHRELDERKHEVKREFESLSTENEQFIDLLSRATDHRSRFYGRMRLWGERLAGLAYLPRSTLDFPHLRRNLGKIPRLEEFPSFSPRHGRVAIRGRR